MKLTGNEPWIENYPPLRDWLHKIDARCISQIKDGAGFIETWRAGAPSGLVFVVEVRANKNGWNIYTASSNNRVDATLADAEARLGLVPASQSEPDNLDEGDDCPSASDYEAERDERQHRHDIAMDERFGAIGPREVA